MSLLLLAGCIFLSDSPADERGACQDREDNDGDGHVDCDDQDCEAAPACRHEPRDTGPDTGEDTGEDTGGCGVVVESTVPPADSVDAYYRAPLEFVLSEPDPTVEVESVLGGTMSLSPDGRTVIFTPAAPLSPSTGYSVTLHGCFGSVELSFTTSALGTPVADPSTLVGRTWAIDPADGRWETPPGIAGLMSTYATRIGLVQVVSATPSSLSLLGAGGASEVAQDLTVSTAVSPDVDFTANPFFRVTGETSTLDLLGIPVVVEEPSMEGSFAADGSSIGGARLAGLMDTRSVAVLIDKDDPHAMCQTASSFGAHCVPCADGEEYCLEFVVDQLTAPEVVDLDLVEVTEGSAACATVSAGAPLAWWGLVLLARRRRASRGR